MDYRLYFLRFFLTKRIFIRRSLQYCFGIGLTRSKKICSLLGLHPNCNYKNLFKRYKLRYSQYLLNKISFYMDRSYALDAALKRKYLLNVKKLKNIKCYKGFRHTMLLSVRGQRTHTNASSFKKVVLGSRNKHEQKLSNFKFDKKKLKLVKKNKNENKRVSKNKKSSNKSKK